VWRSVIQLNLVRSIRTILDAVVGALHARAARVDSGDESDGSEDLGPLDDVRALAARLAPVRTVEAALIAQLVPRDEDEPTRLRADEVFVRSGTSWKGQLAASRSWKGKAASRPGSPGGASSTLAAPADEELTATIHACRLDMLALWNHSSTREILRRRRIRLDESPGLCVPCTPRRSDLTTHAPRASWTTSSE
jgi:hypothetical protein